MAGSRVGVAVLGLGEMGGALAGAVLDGGHPTTVWNRTAGKGEALVAKGRARPRMFVRPSPPGGSWWST
ncbi:NAD(P)-binding domain-containing protein [Spirillospora sp. CA-108201]